MLPYEAAADLDSCYRALEAICAGITYANALRYEGGVRAGEEQSMLSRLDCRQRHFYCPVPSLVIPSRQQVVCTLPAAWPKSLIRLRDQGYIRQGTSHT